MLCVLILYISEGTYSLKSAPSDRFFEKLCMAIFIYPQSFCQKSFERKSSKKYFLYFVLMSGLGFDPFTANKPTHYLLDYGDFTTHTTHCLCVNFIREWRITQFPTANNRFLRNFFMSIKFTKNLVRGNRRSNTFYILF